jgi:hypothetical protein
MWMLDFEKKTSDFTNRLPRTEEEKIEAGRRHD